MKNWKDIIRHTTFRYIDHSVNRKYTSNAMTSFAIDDALAISVSNEASPPAVRLWVHPNTIVLGIPDGKLPHIKEGVMYLTSENYNVVVRNSGGLAVALDEGVLNISLVLPNVKHISIYDCYEAMVSFVQYMLRDLTEEIKAYEIEDSYCPGDYDLSINGKKFAGISQRRVKDGAAIQIYLDVEGDSHKRASMIKKFYEISKRGEQTNFNFPEVNPNVMGSLSDLLGIKISVDDMKRRVYHALRDFTEEMTENDLTTEEISTFKKRYTLMKKRNEVITEILERK
ncbi:lipoate--protein ligase family protein [Virgibacillus halodenitrificans]|uniref:Octanoyl-[GcvH]:protein N-octanoyltransferase n=1 Tax=Virgibacillus halodenitrificans TaxID=1482 RepID=A0ABR7VHW4_VIRHA|nr:lipoate--protein ligase family protein [Virgibacillus halodenitrificans]MBD1221529.1 lipoate--protein ligase family protein [Virgibacillus halodenitrificans]